jgi:tellurite methyltransferase
VADADRTRWNERYQSEEYDFTPATWLRALEPILREHPVGARALDLACGGGRNALYLAELGYTVDAWDISNFGLSILIDELARRAQIGQPLPVQPLQVDLERTPIPPETYDLVLDTHYLERSLFGGMARALRPGGRLIVHTFLNTPGGPITNRINNPDFMLQPGELRATFTDLEILELVEDGAIEQAHLLARRRPVT